MNKWLDMSVYFVASMAGAVLTFLVVGYGGEGYRFFSYASPTIIIASVFFFLFFTKISFKNKVVNWIAVSAFAVYVLDCEGHFWTFYLSTNHSWWLSGTPLAYMIKTLLLDMAVFVVAILLDKLRITIWKQLKYRVP